MRGRTRNQSVFCNSSASSVWRWHFGTRVSVHSRTKLRIIRRMFPVNCTFCFLQYRGNECRSWHILLYNAVLYDLRQLHPYGYMVFKKLIYAYVRSQHFWRGPTLLVCEGLHCSVKFEGQENKSLTCRSNKTATKTSMSVCYSLQHHYSM